MNDVDMQCVLQKVIQNQLVQLCHDIDGEQSSASCWVIKPSLVGGLCPYSESSLFFSSKVIWDFFQVHVPQASSTSQNTCKDDLVEPFFSLHFQDNVNDRGIANNSDWVSTASQLLDHVTHWLKLSRGKDIAGNSERKAWGEGTKMFWFTNAMFRGACSSESTQGLANKNIQPWNFSMSETREESTEEAIKFLWEENKKIKESLKLTQQKIVDIQNEMIELYEKRKRTCNQDTHQGGFGLEEGQDVIKQYFDFQDKLNVLDRIVQDTTQDALNADPEQSKKNNASLKKLNHAMDGWLICMRHLVKREDCSADVKAFWAHYSELRRQREQKAILQEKERINRKYSNSLWDERLKGLDYNVFWQQGLLLVGLNVSERIAGLNLNKFFQPKDEFSSSERAVIVPSWTYRQMLVILSEMKPDDQFYSALSFDYHFLDGKKVSDCKLHVAFTGHKNGFWNRKKPWSKMFLIDLLRKKCFVELSSKKGRMADSESFDYALMNKLCAGVSRLWGGHWNQLVKQCLMEGTRGVMRCGRDALVDVMRESIGATQQNASPFLEKYVYERGSDYQNPERTLFDSEWAKGKKRRPVKCYGFASSD